METTSFVAGTPVSFEYVRYEDTLRIYARILSIYSNNDNFVTCITPHGSVFRVSQDKLYLLEDKEYLSRLQFIEKESMSINFNMYNTLFDHILNFENNVNEVV